MRTHRKNNLPSANFQIAEGEKLCFLMCLMCLKKSDTLIQENN